MGKFQNPAPKKEVAKKIEETIDPSPIEFLFFSLAKIVVFMVLGYLLIFAGYTLGIIIFGITFSGDSPLIAQSTRRAYGVVIDLNLMISFPLAFAGEFLFYGADQLVVDLIRDNMRKYNALLVHVIVNACIFSVLGFVSGRMKLVTGALLLPILLLFATLAYINSYFFTSPLEMPALLLLIGIQLVTVYFFALYGKWTTL